MLSKFLFSKIMLLNALHCTVVVLQFDLVILNLLIKTSNTFSEFSVILKKAKSLRLEIVQFIAQFPYLILSVLLHDRPVELLYHSFCLPLHFLHLTAH